MGPHMFTIITFYLMVRELETSGIRKKIKYQRRPYLEKWGGIIERIYTLVSEDLSLGSSSATYKSVITK